MTGRQLPPHKLSTRQDLILTPDPRRVIVKLFVPGESDTQLRTPTQGLIDRIADLDDDETSHLLQRTLDRKSVV